MRAGKDGEKVVATCTSCGSVFAAQIVSDGSVLPIGRPQGCQCGSDEFEPATSSRDRDFEGISD
ncbi:hypothetical protein CP556_10915 [Natrinema sp. CBA1119]|nr:hypothetical protein CP556_10915 [Natrinema sp. CBA1119]